MALPEAFYEAVNNGDILGVRIMMKNSLLFDRTFAQFSEMEKEAAKMNGLYDVHDGRELITDKSKWDDNYMNLLMVQVTKNFSHERLNHLKEVVRYLRPPKENYSREILDATLLVRDETVLWSDDAFWPDGPDLQQEAPFSVSYIKALNLKWQKIG